MSKKFYWLKLKDDFFNQNEIKKLRRIAGGDTYTIIYLKLQLLSLKKEAIITFDGTERNLAEQLSYEIDENVDNIEVTLSFLRANNLIEQVSENDFLLPKTSECIGKEGSSAERVRRHRERKALEQKQKEMLLLQSNAEALQCNGELLQCNGEVTKCNTEKEKEKEKDILKKENNKNKSSLDLIIEEYTDKIELIDMLKDFLKMRKSIKKPMTDRALKILLTKLDKLAGNDINKKLYILEESIVNSWQSIFEPKNYIDIQKSTKEPKKINFEDYII